MQQEQQMKQAKTLDDDDVANASSFSGSNDEGGADKFGGRGDNSMELEDIDDGDSQDELMNDESGALEEDDNQEASDMVSFISLKHF